MVANAQVPPVHSYYVNDGKDDAHQPSHGEFAPDLGGQVPFIRYSDIASSGGHRYARSWNATAAGTVSFEAMMRKGILDLDYLDAQIDAYCTLNPPLPPTVLPFPPGAYSLEAGPLVAATWWQAAGGGGLRSVMMWPYRLNGGAVMIVIRIDPATGLPSPNANPSILVSQYPYHHSDFQPSRNRSHDDPNGEFEFEFKRPKGGWTGPLSAPILAPDEQAVEAGDVVVVVQENYSDSPWIALQRVQEANWFVRRQFALAPPAPGGGSFPAFEALSAGSVRTFLHGYSWGALMSNFLALMQPKVYAGATAMAIDDLSYGFQDKLDFQTFFVASIGAADLVSLADPLYSIEFSLVDLLGIRFDDGSGNWDLAAFSMNRRPSTDTLQVPVYGLVGDEDFIFNHHWAQRDGGPGGNAYQRTAFQRFREHGTYGVIPNVNEYATYDGTEWQTAKINGVTASNNVDLVPPPPPTGFEAFPDPYSHTLRHPAHAPTISTLLTELDLAGKIDPASSNHKAQVSNVNTLGQGVWIGAYDNLRVANVDYDDKIEVVFGNLDGFVHVLEFDPARDPTDPFKLYDEWKSPYLGRQVQPMAGAGLGYAARGYFANARGEFWKIKPESAGGFSFVAGVGGVVGAPIATPNSLSQKFLYDGVTSALYIGDFDPMSGNELIAVNRFMDWSMFTVAGASLGSSARHTRSTRMVGPTQAAVVNANLLDTDKELLVPAMDGHVWLVDPHDQNGNYFSKPDVFIPFTGLGLYKVEPCYFNGGTTPTHLLVFGRDDARNDTNPALSTNVIQLYDFSSKALLATADSISFGEPKAPFVGSFEWIVKPFAGSTSGDFVITDGRQIQKLRVTKSPAAIAPVQSATMFAMDPGPPPDPYSGDKICALEGATMSLGSGNHFYLVVGTACGRIYVVDENLNAVRKSDKEGGVPSGAAPAAWPSNRTLARGFANDFTQDLATGASEFYFADFGQVHHDTASFRLGSMAIPASIPASGVITWNPRLTNAKPVAGPSLNRTLIYRDLDGAPGKEPYLFSETGTAIVDTSGPTTVVREFQNTMANQSLFLDLLPRGGHVYEFTRTVGSSNRGPGNYLGNFSVPRDTSVTYGDYRSGDDWWYPSIGAYRLTGQIASYEQSVRSQMQGTCMKAVQMRKQAGGSVTPHVVTGTYGGYVYAIEPGPLVPAPIGFMRKSNLSFVSQDLGLQVMGLDAADIDGEHPDGDVDVELAVGCVLDTGDYVDWVNGATNKNRGHLYILNPVPSASGKNGGFVVTDLNADNLGLPGSGIGSGVTGVKFDDVNNDGVNEIWCGDAIGHIYLFRKAPLTLNTWSCFYRSGELGCFPGCYNNIYPIKDTAVSSSNYGRTVKLLITSPGYVMLFAVDPTWLVTP